MYMFRAIQEFAQSRDCATHSQNPEIAHQSRDCALNLEIAQCVCAISRLRSKFAQSRDCASAICELFGDHLCRHCSQPIPTDQSLFEHISQVKPSSIINSLKDLSDQENFATAIEFLFDVGHKFCLLHVQSQPYLTPLHCSDVIILSQSTFALLYHPLLFQYLSCFFAFFTYSCVSLNTNKPLTFDL